VDTASLRALFTKPYGAPAPTQERQGIAAYLAAQEGLIQRCDGSKAKMRDTRWSPAIAAYDNSPCRSQEFCAWIAVPFQSPMPIGKPNCRSRGSVECC
jgi:hypothetical protein